MFGPPGTYGLSWAIYQLPTGCQPARGQVARTIAKETAVHEHNTPYHLVPPGHPGARPSAQLDKKSAAKAFRRAAAEAESALARLRRHEQSGVCRDKACT